MPLVSCDTSVPYASVRRIVCAKGGLKIGRVGNDGKVRVVLAGTGFLYCINIYSNMYKSAVASYHTEVKRNFAVSCTVDVLEEGKGGGGGDSSVQAPESRAGTAMALSHTLLQKLRRGGGGGGFHRRIDRVR